MAEKKKKTKKDKKWIQSAIKRPGTFTAKAKKKGLLLHSFKQMWRKILMIMMKKHGSKRNSARLL